MPDPSPSSPRSHLTTDPAREKDAVILIKVPMATKARYVHAAQRAGMKLVPWMLEQCDNASDALLPAKTSKRGAL